MPKVASRLFCTIVGNCQMLGRIVEFSYLLPYQVQQKTEYGFLVFDKLGQVNSVII